MRLLITGAGGMLGREIVAQAPAGFTMVALDRRALDVTDAAAARAVIEPARPDWVIHCAAYTKVDQAESEPTDAYLVNAAGTLNVATAARAASACMLYLSTDYVFDGRSDRPWKEEDPTAPLGVYGRSKLAGEFAVRDVLPDRHLIVRTQWLFGVGGRNFVATIVARATEGLPLRVVTDQIGAPTYAADLAEAILRLIVADARGTYHVANSGQASWFEVATHALERAGLATEPQPCTSEELGRPARRPRYSVLDCSRFVGTAGAPLRPWRSAVDAFLTEREAATKGRRTARRY